MKRGPIWAPKSHSGYEFQEQTTHVSVIKSCLAHARRSTISVKAARWDEDDVSVQDYICKDM